MRHREMAGDQLLGFFVRLAVVADQAIVDYSHLGLLAATTTGLFGSAKFALAVAVGLLAIDHPVSFARTGRETFFSAEVSRQLPPGKSEMPGSGITSNLEGNFELDRPPVIVSRVETVSQPFTADYVDVSDQTKSSQ
jgi:hypothetical protein